MQSLPSPINAVDVRQRTPTLLAGEIAGSQGQVQVWSPDTAVIKKHTRQAFGAAALTALALAAALASGAVPFLLLLLLPVLYCTWLCAATLPVYRKPRYITTDIAGIGITTTDGSRCFKWDDLVHATFTYSGGMYLRSRSDERVHINLYGYTPDEIWALFDLIVRRSDLSEQRLPGPVDGKSCTRPGFRVSILSGKLISLPSAALPNASLPPPENVDVFKVGEH